MFYVNARFLTKRITGLERYALELSLALNQIENNITFLSPKIKFNNGNIKKLNPLEIGYSQDYLWEQLELPVYLKKIGNPSLLNLTNTSPVFYRNQILVIHDVAFLHNPGWFTTRAALFFKFIVKKSAKAAKKIVTVSEFSKREIIKYLKIPSNQIEVIYSGIPQGILECTNAKSANEFGDYILTVSSLEPRKNIISLIKAFLMLSQPELKLIIVGEKNQKVFRNSSLDFSRHKNIIFLGYVNDDKLARLYKNARLFTYLSLYEGFGFPPVEAIANGCPTLVSNTSCLPEICGDYAEYTDPLNLDEISAKMKMLLSKNAKINNSKVSEFRIKYNWQTCAEKILKVMKENSN